MPFRDDWYAAAVPWNVVVIVTAAEDMSYDVHTLEEYLPMHFHLEF